MTSPSCPLAESHLSLREESDVELDERDDSRPVERNPPATATREIPKMFRAPLPADELERCIDEQRFRDEQDELRGQLRRASDLCSLTGLTPRQRYLLKRMARSRSPREQLALKYARRERRPAFDPCPVTKPAAITRRAPRHVAGRSTARRRTTSRASRGAPSSPDGEPEPAPAGSTINSRDDARLFVADAAARLDELGGAA